MVVLDVIDAALREALGELRQLRGRQALRFERRAGQRPRGRTDAPAHLMQPVARAAESLHKLGRQLDIVQHHVIVDRGVAEQHVDQLPGIVADGRGGQRDAHLEQAMAQIADGEHAADDLGEHDIVVDRRKRHLDALLDRNGAGAALDRARIAADVIDGLKTDTPAAL